VDKAIESDGPVRNVVDKSQMIQMDRLVGKSQQPSAHNEEHIAAHNFATFSLATTHAHERVTLHIYASFFFK
jgi:hypothetical protein